MTRSRDVLTFEQEVAISDLDHGNLYTAMTGLAETAFEDPGTVQDWHLQGIPLKPSALPGVLAVGKGLEYDYMDLLVSTKPNAMADSPECAISFHGHPLDYSLEILLGSEDAFTFHPEYGRSQRTMRLNQEEKSAVPKAIMLDYLFRLMGEDGVPETVQHPDQIDFDTRLGLQTLMAQLSARLVARRETIVDRVQGLTIVGDSTTASEVVVDFSRIREERPEQHQTLRLVAQTAVRLWEDTVARKELTYAFRKGERLDGEHTSARLKITAWPHERTIDTTDFQRMVMASLRDAEETLASDLIAASDVLPYSTASYDTSWHDDH